MGKTYTEGKRLDDVLRWFIHASFCFEEVTLNNGKDALVVGSGLMGRLALYVSPGVFKILDSNDSITASSVICTIIDPRTLDAAAGVSASSIATRCLILRRGPALVHGDEILFADSVNVATAKSAIEAQGVQLVYETGLKYLPASV